MRIRRAMPSDISELKDLYYGTITTINSRDYNAEQIKAWAGTAERTESLLRRINEQDFFIAETESGQITGFGSVDNTGYLDLLYVHKEFQRMGTATLLVARIVQTAVEKKYPKIVTDASITARPFFEGKMFRVIQQQTVEINQVVLVNFKMERTL